MDTDFLVIGSGIAGLSFARRVAELGDVVVVTKKESVNTATNLAQGGIAAVLSVDDSLESHVQDTLRSGADLCDRSVVEMVIGDGPERIKDLIDIGVAFNRDSDSGQLDLGREGGHSARRVAHSLDLTGREIERALIAALKDKENVDLLENHSAVDLIMVQDYSSTSSKCVGAYVLEQDGVVQPYRAKITVLCTGGCGKVYLYTSNPDISTGDGIAMAFRAGAHVTNMEFVQFHPTCLFHPKAKNFLISEAVRGEGAQLIDHHGTRFMYKYDKRAELATRDTVARAIDKEMKERGLDCLYLDISFKGKEFIKKRFPNIYERCLGFGVDLTREPIPVVPAAHYMCGGVLVDHNGLTTITGLMALGETAHTGLHGADRLASNSLLEAVVYAEKAFQYCKLNVDQILKDPLPQVDKWASGEAVGIEEEILINHNWDLIRRTMWNYVGIVRTEKRLALAHARMKDIILEIEQHYRDYLVTQNMIELRNISQVAMLIIGSAIVRKESRGLHFTIDYPVPDQAQRCWNLFKREHGVPRWSIVQCGKHQV